MAALFTPFVINILEIQKRAMQSSTGKKANGSFALGTELFRDDYKIDCNMARLAPVAVPKGKATTTS